MYFSVLSLLQTHQTEKANFTKPKSASKSSKVPKEIEYENEELHKLLDKKQKENSTLKKRISELEKK